MSCNGLSYMHYSQECTRALARNAIHICYIYFQEKVDANTKLTFVGGPEATEIVVELQPKNADRKMKTNLKIHACVKATTGNVIGILKLPIVSMRQKGRCLHFQFTTMSSHCYEIHLGKTTSMSIY